MLGVLEGFAIILMVIFIGYLLARFRVITSDDQRLVLNRVAFYAATPALIFMVVSQSSRDALFSPVILVEALTALVTRRDLCGGVPQVFSHGSGQHGDGCRRHGLCQFE